MDEVYIFDYAYVVARDTTTGAEQAYLLVSDALSDQGTGHRCESFLFPPGSHSEASSTSPNVLPPGGYDLAITYHEQDPEDETNEWPSRTLWFRDVKQEFVDSLLAGKPGFIEDQKTKTTCRLCHAPDSLVGKVEFLHASVAA